MPQTPRPPDAASTAGSGCSLAQPAQAADGMFYSHQLLARKAPLSQIWITATFKAKINRRRLDKLDIIKICEEILNPSVPTTLRPSGILMGEPPLGDYYLAAFLAGFALPSYSNDVSRLLVNLELKVCSAFY
ncbi:hypothetical protein ZWY2020_011868 [Hordeum vulgare]|nr:hypothetical protein ZWY2020_011868 [Hordeum vulgare]